MALTTVKVPYGSATLGIELPGNWKVSTLAPKDLPKLSHQGIRNAIQNPIGTENISDMARGKKTVAIVVDDFTRPTPISLILTIVLNELEGAGIGYENITIVTARGAHREMTKEELRQKIGDETMNQVKVVNHDFHKNLNFEGKSKAGVPIWLNKTVAEADLKIGVGGIIPHSTAGFGGGAKIVLPGVCGLETIKTNHRFQNLYCMGNVNNDMRKDIEDVAGRIGLSFVVNILINAKIEICGVFAGDYIDAHRKGVEMANQLYRVRLGQKPDVVISSTYPLDHDMNQAIKAVEPAVPVIADGGSLLLLAPCFDGLGYHALYEPDVVGTTEFLDAEKEYLSSFLNKADFTFYTNNKGVTKDLFYGDKSFYVQGVVLTHSLDVAINRLAKKHHDQVSVAVLLCGPLTIPYVAIDRENINECIS